MPDERSDLSTERPANDAPAVDPQAVLLRTGALQNAIFNSANFSCIATDEKGTIQLFNVGAERMLGYAAVDVVGKLTPADISDPQEVIDRAKALSLELDTPIAPGFDALVFKASRGMEDIYELTKVRKAGSRFPAVVSVTALRDEAGAIIGYLLIGTDNTARKQAEEALRRSEDRTQFALRLTHIGYWDLDLVNRTGHHSLGLDIILGYDSPQPHYTLDTFLDHVLPEDRAAVERQLEQSKANLTDWDCECRIRRADGEIRWIWVTGEHQPDAAGHMWHMSGIIQDITARKEAQLAQLHTGPLQNAIFNSAAISLVATDEKGVIQLFNVGAEQMLGYTAAEVVDKVSPADLSDPQELADRARTLTLELGTPVQPGFEALVCKASRGIEDIYELTKVRKDGTRFPAIVSNSALRNPLGDIIGYLLIATDNTARKQVEAEQLVLDQRLRDQQFYTRSLIESNVDALMTTDPRGVITDVNQQMELLTGCTRDELIGAPFKSYFTEPERAEAAIRRVLAEGRVTDYELTARARDGMETVVSYNATTFYDRERKLQGVFAAARDVTERKRFEHKLQESNVALEAARANAEKANLAKSDFLSRMSHELRSPLHTMLGFAQLIDGDNPPPTLAQTASVEQILKAGWYLLELINEILDLAQIESGKLALSREPISLTELMRECRSMVVPQGRKRGVRVTFPESSNPFFVDADRTRLKQVLINLLSNAIQYNHANGTVVVECAMSTNVKTPGRTRVSITDTGAGLSPEMLLQLFQPFNRLGRERSAVEGTGIGLVMSKKLVELMGGIIGVESTVGSGSVFWFELNSVPEPSGLEADAPPVLDHSPLQLGAPQCTMLYVEDNPANLQLIEQLLASRRPDIRLLSASDGIEGIRLAQANQPDVILMDINLPGMSGIEALTILREDIHTSHIPVIALSANAMPRDIKKGLDAGFFRYLTKPIKVKALLETLESALELAVQEPV